MELDDRVLTDDALVDLMRGPRVCKIGIDAPFGWPLAFIDTLSTYRDEGTWLALDNEELLYRATEIAIAVETNRRALSVAVGHLPWPAMRCARLLSRTTAPDKPLDRSGSGLPVEVYPMAALSRWGVIAAGAPTSAWSYKDDKPGRRDHREQHLVALLDKLDNAVTLTDQQAQRFIADDDDLDAFVSALIARAAHIGKTDPIPRGSQWIAMREGWIHLPAPNSLAHLAAEA